MNTKKHLSILLTLCLVVGLAALATLTVWATQAGNVIDENTTWSVVNEDGVYRWISKPTNDPQAEPNDLIVTGDGAAGIIAPVTIDNGKTLTIEMPMVSIPPLNIQSIRSGDNNGGAVKIVQPVPAWGDQLSVNGIDGETSTGPTPAGDGGTAVQLDGGMTIDIYEELRVTIQGGKGGSCTSIGAGGKGGTAVDCALTVENGSVTVKGGEGGQNNHIPGESGAPGTGVGTNGSVMLKGGNLTIEGGESKVSSVAGGTGVEGTVTLAGGTLTVNGGKAADGGNRGPAFGDGAKVVIANGYAYTDGTTKYEAGEYTTDLNTKFGGKKLVLCEAKIGETFYATLKDAMGAAWEGDTVTLLKDIELKEPLNHDEITLDLNGKTITFTQNETEPNGHMPFTYVEHKMMTLEGSGTIEALGIGTSENVVTLWRFSLDGGTGTLTIVNDVKNDKVTCKGNRPWEAFMDNINAVVMENGVTRFTYMPFAYCKNLKTVTISASVTEGYDEKDPPFADCPILEAINVDPDNSAFTNNEGDGVLYTKDKKTLLYCPRGKTGTLTVPAAVTKLVKNSFNENDGGTVNHSVMQLSRIEFARTEAGEIDARWAFNSYEGNCVLAAADGMFIQSKSVVQAKDYNKGLAKLSFRPVTPWDELQAALNVGGTVTLKRSYDYTVDSYETTSFLSGTSIYGALYLPKDTVLDLNGYTLTADEVYGDGNLTVKGGTLNCTGLMNMKDESDGKLPNGGTSTEPNYGTLTLIDATVTVNQWVRWNGGMDLTKSDLTIGWGKEASDGGSKPVSVSWMPQPPSPEGSRPMLAMDAASSLTLPQPQMSDGTRILLFYASEAETEYVIDQLSCYWPRDCGSEIKSFNNEYVLSAKDLTTGKFPASVTLRVPVYNVTVTDDGHGEGAADPAAGVKGAEITLSATPDAGYEFKAWQVISGGVTVTDNSFTIGAADVEVMAVFEAVVYKVTVTDDGHGKASADLSSGVIGTSVTLSATPDAGYEFKEWQVISGGVTVEDGVFTIGAADVEVKAVFEHSVSGSFNNSGKLVATVTAPKDSVLIAASYKSTGQQADIKTYAISAAINGGTYTFDDLTMGSDFTYKLMLVDSATYAPLCTAWDNTKLTVSNGVGSGE